MMTGGNSKFKLHTTHTIGMQDLQYFLCYCAVFRFPFNKHLKENIVPSLVIRYNWNSDIVNCRQIMALFNLSFSF